VFHLGKYNILDYTLIYARRWWQFAGWIKDCEVGASVVFPAYKLNDDKCPVSRPMMERCQLAALQKKRI
jgi:hypothetical protein